MEHTMLHIDKSKCMQCGLCIQDCVRRALYMENGLLKLRDNCSLCGHCIAICRPGAIRLACPSYDAPEEITHAFGRLEPDLFLDAIKCRRSIRNYQTRPVEREWIDKLLKAASYTAAAKNERTMRFIVIQKRLPVFRELIFRWLDQQEHWSAFHQGKSRPPKDEMLFRNAPAVLYILSKNVTDAALAAQNMEMLANACGLGVLYNGYLRQITSECEEALRFLQATDTHIGICMLLGYPAVSYVRTAPRKLPDYTIL